MAEALARHLVPDIIEASSAGVMALGHVASPTRAALEENGVSCEGLLSKALQTVNLDAVDMVVNMSGHPMEKHLEGKALPVEDWDVGDPYGSDLAIYRQIRDEIERRVLDLAARLRQPRRSVTDMD
jgi:protein-tyrosine-phosphatase